MTNLELLAQAQAGDQAAEEQLVQENSRLIWSIVRRFQGRGAETDDLYQQGCLGFLKAVKGYDPAYGTQFSTYAVPKITGEIRRYLRDDQPVKLSRSVYEQRNSLYQVKLRLEERLGRAPSVSELAEETGLCPEELAALELSWPAPVSLQTEVEEGLPLESLVAADNPEGRLIDTLALRQLLRRLNEEEQSLIRLRYFKGLTQTQTAKILHTSQVQISRREKRILDKLRADFQR